MTSEATRVPLIWHPVGEAGISDDLDAHNSAVVDELARLIKAGDREAVTQALKRWPPAHLVGLFVYLPLKRARVLINWLDQYQARVVAELNPSFRHALLEDVTLQRLVEVLEGLEPEEAADILYDFPEEVVQQVLPRLPERAAIESSRGYEEESAGSIMSRKFVAVPPEWTVGQVTSEVRAHAREMRSSMRST